jgi:hypothetical protein
MGRPKLDPRLAQTVNVSGKMRPHERAALDKVIAAKNAQRREAGDPMEIGVTDWIRAHLYADAKTLGIPIELTDPTPPSLAPKAQKGGKPARKK